MLTRPRALSLGSLLPAGLLLLATTGCLLGPDYRRPPVAPPEAWREMGAPDANSIANTAWWDLYADPQLQELIRIALNENKDLKIAIERITEARALYGFTKADLYPRVDASAAAGSVRSSEVGPLQLPPGTDTSSAFYRLEGDLSWEIDIFGRIRRATEAQLALLLATEEARRSVVITLVADVARVYVELRDFDLRLEISKRTLLSRQEYLELARLRFEGGLTSELDYRQAEAELHRTETFVYTFEAIIAQKENELSVLLGRNPGAVIRGVPMDQMMTPPAVPAGLPSDLLERRPDIRQAEQELVAANAQIGEAKALLFPRIALTGYYGWESRELGDLFTSPARIWSIAGNLLQPIFNAGKNRRRVEVTESRMRQFLYGYEQTILESFREVDDSLVGYRKAGERRVSEAARVQAERKVLDLAETRYRGGVSDYLEVLDAQRSLFSAELDEAATISNHLTSFIQLYKALGGGWIPPDGTQESAEAAAADSNQAPKP